MLCVLCGNAAAGGKLRPVALPAEHDEILAHLAVRPLHQRTWVVGEPTRNLYAENVQHGYETEADDPPDREEAAS
jgi:hypothetical protein